MHVSDIGLVFRIHKDISKLSNKKTNNTILKWAKDRLQQKGHKDGMNRRLLGKWKLKPHCNTTIPIRIVKFLKY